MTAAPIEQRWLEGRERWRHPSDRSLFDPREYGVELLPTHRDARAFVERHHYSGSWVAARLVLGLYRKVGCLRSHLAGVCVFSVPMQPASIPHHTGVAEGVELGRLVLLDEVGFNGESWFVARALDTLADAMPWGGPRCTSFAERLRMPSAPSGAAVEVSLGDTLTAGEVCDGDGLAEDVAEVGPLSGIRAVLSYSDPVRRVTDDGRVVTPGHVGQVYQALNATYVGRGGGRNLYLDRDGRTMSSRAIGKIRGQELGWEPAAARLVAAGCDRRQPGEEPADWLDRVLSSLRRLKHPGNHAYVWRLDGVKLPSLPFPRRHLEAA